MSKERGDKQYSDNINLHVQTYPVKSFLSATIVVTKTRTIPSFIFSNNDHKLVRWTMVKETNQTFIQRSHYSLVPALIQWAGCTVSNVRHHTNHISIFTCMCPAFRNERYMYNGDHISSFYAWLLTLDTCPAISNINKIPPPPSKKGTSACPLDLRELFVILNAGSKFYVQVLPYWDGPWYTYYQFMVL